MADAINDNQSQEPDGARPAKRIRLQAPLELTTTTRDEMQEEDDWDDVYGANSPAIPDSNTSIDAPEANPPASAVPASANVQPPTIPPVHNGNASEKDARPLPEGVPAGAISHGDELVDDTSDQPVLEPQEQRVLDETTDIIHGEPSPQSKTDGAEAVNANASVQEREPDSGHAGAEVVSETNTTESSDVTMLDTIGLIAPPEKVTEDAEFMAAAAAQRGTKDSEWQFDSSDAESSSDSDTSSDSSDEDSGSDDGYELLDPATAARMLMADDGGEDGDNKREMADKDYQPRTANEVKEEVIPKPDVTITAEMRITLLGNVTNMVGNMILIKGATPGEYQVLESGSVLCNESRTVVGAVAETFGRVQEPLYSVAFTNADEIKELGLEFGSNIYYVDDHSTFVFTQPLKNLKGTDASNIHDEEVNEDEQEFSDDEKEAEFKRQRKEAKRAGRGALSRSAFTQGRGNHAGPSSSDDRKYIAGTSDAPSQSYGGGLSYDDDEAGEEFYAPLKRPDNLSELMAGGRPPRSFDRGRGRGRGDRGDRGRGRGRGRGGFQQQRAGGGADRNSSRGQQQQKSHRDNAQGFVDRRPDHAQGYQAAAQPPHAAPPQQYPSEAQQQQPQTYQFNGYQFQYGSTPQAASAQQYQNYYAQQTQQSSAGSYVNPAYYQQQAQAYAAYAEQYPQAYAGQPQTNAGAQQVPDIGAILRNLGQQPPPQ